MEVSQRLAPVAVQEERPVWQAVVVGHDEAQVGGDLFPHVVRDKVGAGCELTSTLGLLEQDEGEGLLGQPTDVLLVVTDEQDQGHAAERAQALGSSQPVLRQVLRVRSPPSGPDHPKPHGPRFQASEPHQTGLYADASLRLSLATLLQQGQELIKAEGSPIDAQLLHAHRDAVICRAGGQLNRLDDGRGEADTADGMTPSAFRGRYQGHLQLDGSAEDNVAVLRALDDQLGLACTPTDLGDCERLGWSGKA